MLKFFRRWFKREPAHPWRAIRFHGGGIINSPYDMTESEAMKWISVAVKGEVAYIDREYGFIFYRPKE
jgi:hypothetical protein